MISSPSEAAGLVFCATGATGLADVATGPWQPARASSAADTAATWMPHALAARHTGKSLLAQGAAQLAEVGMVPRLHRAHDIHRGNIRSTEGAVVLDVLHARPASGDDARQFRQAAGPVADRHGEARQAAVVDEALFDDPAEHGGVDVAATDGEHDLLAAQFRQQAG